MKRPELLVVVLLLVATAAQAGVRVYDVDVYKNVNAWTHHEPNHWVSQSFVSTVDSMVYAEWFVGAPNDTGEGKEYVFQILTYPALGLLYEGRHVSGPSINYEYVHANLTRIGDEPLIKGKTYVLKVYHSAGESLNYYYDERNTYKYGHLNPQLGDQSHPEEYFPNDLCARIEGVNRPVSREYFGMNENLSGDRNSGLPWSMLLPLEDSVGVRWHRGGGNEWQAIQYANTLWDWTVADSTIMVAANNGIKILFVLYGTPRWASSRPNDPWPLLNQTIPCSLGLAVESVGIASPRNLWGFFVNQVVARYKPGGFFWNSVLQNDALGDTYGTTYYEVWNEPNYLRSPDSGQGYRIGDSPEDSIAIVESLYARMCDVAVQAARLADPQAEVVVGALGGVEIEDLVVRNPTRLVKGKDWLRGYYRNRQNQDNYGVSVHPYQYGDTGFALDPRIFARDLDTIRAILKANDEEGKTLWATELAWSLDEQPERAALSLPEAHVLGLAGDPVNFYDRLFWFSMAVGRAALVDYTDPAFDHCDKLPCYYAYQQMTQELVGKRLNGRVRNGDTAIDNHSFVYELEDPASLRHSWIGWRTYYDSMIPVQAKMPARTESVDTVCLARNPNPASGSRQAGQDGWLGVSLGSDPIYLKEKTSEPISRPDLVVSSVWTVPETPAVGVPVCFCTRVKNIGTDSSPSGIPSDPSQLPVMFYVDDSAVSCFSWLPSIQKDDSADIWGEANWSPARPGSYLVKVKVNGGKDFMELNWDNNANYRRYRVTHPQHAEMGINPGHKEPVAMTNVPEVILSSLVSDSSFGTTCSMRVAQEYWAASETLPASEDFGWIGYRPSLMWHLNHGAGKYRLEVRFMIVGDSGSGYRDTSVILDDSCHLDLVAPPSGSVAVKCTTRFYAARVCTLIVAGSDDSTGTGLGATHFSTQPFKNLLQNSDFALDASGWEGNGYVYHESLGGIVELPQIRDSLVYFGQMIPSESLEPYLGCPACLSLVGISEGLQPKAALELLYCLVKAETSITGPDTIWQSVCGAALSTGYQSLAGLNDFRIEQRLGWPQDQEGYAFLGAQVRLSLVCCGDENPGKLWVDDLELLVCGQMGQDFAQWQKYDTLALYDLGKQLGPTVVYGELQDNAGNESPGFASDTIVVDWMPPVAVIGFPGSGQIITDTLIQVLGFAFDPPPKPGLSHFWYYKLAYCHIQPSGAQDSTYGILPESLFYEPKAPPTDQDNVSLCGWISLWGHLADWNTGAVLAGTGPGFYRLYLTVLDSALNQAQTNVVVWLDTSTSSLDSVAVTKVCSTALALTASPSNDVYVGTSTGSLLSYTGDLDSLSFRTIRDSSGPAVIASVTTDSAGNVWVSDNRDSSVKCLNAQGVPEDTIGNHTQLHSPNSIAIARNGDVWVADKTQNLIRVYDPSGNLKLSFGSSGSDTGQFLEPVGISLSHPTQLDTSITPQWDTTPNQVLSLPVRCYVCDKGNHRIQVFDTAGTFIALFGRNDLSQPTAISLDTNNCCFVADPGLKAILGFNPAGQRYLTIRPGDTILPIATATSGDNGYLYTIDRDHRTLIKYLVAYTDTMVFGGGQSGSSSPSQLPRELTLYQSYPNPASNQLTIRYSVPKPTKLSLNVYDITGKLTRTLINNQSSRPGKYNQVWNLRDNRNRSIAAGVYFYRLTSNSERIAGSSKQKTETRTRKLVIAR